MTKVYVLKHDVPGTVLEVDGPRGAVSFSTRSGVLVLHGLTPDELRSCGLMLYRHVKVGISVEECDGEGGPNDSK